MSSSRDFRTSAFIQSEVSWALTDLVETYERSSAARPVVAGQRAIDVVSFADEALDTLTRPGPGHGFEPGEDVAALKVVVVLEKLGWLDAGVEAGYLAADAHTRAREGVDRDQRNVLQPLQSMARTYGDSLGTHPRERESLQPVTFAEAYVAGAEELTSEALEFLTLIAFAPKDGWNRRSAELREFGRRLADDPLMSFDEATVDQVAWALTGVRRAGGLRLPSKWRLVDWSPSDHAAAGAIELKATREDVLIERFPDRIELVKSMRDLMSAAFDEVVVDSRTHDLVDGRQSGRLRVREATARHASP